MAYSRHNYEQLRELRLTHCLCVRCGGKRDREDRLQCQKCREHSPKGIKGRQRKERQRIFDHYGSHCVCCGETHPHFLALDHTPEAPSRKDNPEQKINLTAWVIKHGFPPGFRILCHNCNMATRYGRTCPHQLEIEKMKAILAQN